MNPNKFKVDDRVVIIDSKSIYHCEPAMLITAPFWSELNGVRSEVAIVKIISREYNLDVSTWQEITILVNTSKLQIDHNRMYDMKRLEVKFGTFLGVNFLQKPIDTKTECCFCCDYSEKRIEIIISGSVYQYDVCGKCARKWDGRIADTPPLKVKAPA